MPVHFDLSSLSGTLVEELLPLTEQTDQPPDAESEPPIKPTPPTPKSTGGAGLLTLDNIGESDYDASFAITWVLLVKSCCFARYSPDWDLADRLTRFLFLTAFLINVGACAVALRFQSTMFVPEIVHWFGWVCFIAFVASEAIFILSRVLIGRFKNLMQRPERAEGQDVGDLWGKIISYQTFNDGLQAWVVTLLQLVSSTAFVSGNLIIITQANIEFESVKNTVAEENRTLWRVGWVAAFLVSTIGFCLCGWLDAARLPEVLDDAPHFHIELIAWRVLLLTIVVPVLNVGYAIFCGVCCPGPLIFS